MVWCNIPLPATAQYPFRVFPLRYAFHSGSIGLCFASETRPFQVRLICSFCSSDRGFASDFLQTPPHDGRPCLWLTVPTAKSVADFHRQVITHAERTTKIPSDGKCRTTGFSLHILLRIKHSRFSVSHYFILSYAELYTVSSSSTPILFTFSTNASKFDIGS